jgi:hypothetical protein
MEQQPDLAIEAGRAPDPHIPAIGGMDEEMSQDAIGADRERRAVRNANIRLSREGLRHGDPDAIIIAVDYHAASRMVEEFRGDMDGVIVTVIHKLEWHMPLTQSEPFQAAIFFK